MHLILPLQGVFVRRHAVQRDDGSGPISPRDLAVDGDITIYGRTVHLIDADAFTRTWYADQLNVQLAPAIAYPQDTVSVYRAAHGLTTVPGAWHYSKASFACLLPSA